MLKFYRDTVGVFFHESQFIFILARLESWPSLYAYQWSLIEKLGEFPPVISNNEAARSIFSRVDEL